MDQSRFWIQKDRSNNCLNGSHVISPSLGDSWEEKAFAQDASSGPLGGCIWPPRSYTCSFCRREFRSAQALGGHMNVHRRDRARLKQISTPPKTNQLIPPLLQNPNDISNPNFDLDHALFSSSSSIRRPFTCTTSFGQEHQKILSWSKFEPQKRFHVTDLDQETCTKVESDSTTSKTNNNDQIEVHCTDHSLSWLVRRTCEKRSRTDNKDDGLILKKRHIDSKDINVIINGDDHEREEAESMIPLECSPNSTLESLDLELRLGDRP